MGTAAGNAETGAGAALGRSLDKLAQTAIVFAVGGLLFGYRPNGSVPAIAIVVVVFTAMLVCFGVMLVALCRTMDQANTIGMLGGMVMAGLGGALAALAILSRTELLLVLIGGLFLVVTGSVILQRTWFKITKWRYGQGRRIFLMSPLHHHFELKGWAEITVVVRFWLISALFVAVGVGFFYLEWINQ